MDSAPPVENFFLSKFFGKRSPTWPLYILFFIYLIIDKGPTWIDALKKDTAIPTVLPAQTALKPALEDECILLTPLESNSIKISYDKIQKTGEYYSPTGAGNTLEGIIWLEKALKPSFRKVFIEYEIITKNKNKPPSFIWNIAREGKKNNRQVTAKIWAPEYTEIDGAKIPQLIGFAQTKDYTENSLERRIPEELPDPVKRGQLDSLTIEPTNVNGTEMDTNFIYNFTSERNNIAVPYSFTRKLIFPFSNLSNSNELLDIGIGTYIGNEIRIVSLKVCY